MLQEQIDMVAGDFNGAAWLRQSGSDSRPIRIIEEAFANACLPIPPAPHLCGDQDACQANGRMCAGFRNRRVLRMNGKSACMKPSQSLSACWASRKQIKVATTKFESTSSTFMLGWLIVFHETTNLADQIEKEELTLRPQQGKEAASVKRHRSRPRYVSPM